MMDFIDFSLPGKAFPLDNNNNAMVVLPVFLIRCWCSVIYISCDKQYGGTHMEHALVVRVGVVQFRSSRLIAIVSQNQDISLNCFF